MRKEKSNSRKTSKKINLSAFAQFKNEENEKVITADRIWEERIREKTIFKFKSFHDV